MTSPTDSAVVIKTANEWFIRFLPEQRNVGLLEKGSDPLENVQLLSMEFATVYGDITLPGGE
jgi:hypothetical protein